MENKEQISMRVRELRAQKNFTVEQMAELLGVTPEEYSLFESGAKQAPFSFYYNLAGQRTDTPSGLTIVVTRYSDGSVRREKKLFR